MRFSLLRKTTVLTLCLWLLPLQACTSSEKAGPYAPNFTLEDLSGKKVSLSDHRGQFVLIDFWATWCQPCMRSIPELVDLHKKYRERGLVVLGISLDPPNQVDNNRLAAFKEKNRIEYVILRGSEKVLQDYSGPEGMAIPTMFFVDREGRIVERLVGFRPGRVENSLKKLMG
ncbi:MAG: TlpA disulfide reductase family protein [Thermodesulfobacteriota bacterium]